MKIEEIEVGGVYEGPAAISRKVISLPTKNRLLLLPLRNAKSPQEVNLDEFAKWATKRIDTREESK